MENNIDVIVNSGKTFKIENMYRYVPKSTTKNVQSALNRSAVFRPNGNVEDQKRVNNQVYHNSYRFDLIKNRRHMRKTWVHISDAMPGYSQNEIQVAPGDRLQIGFCFLNLNGFVDMDSLTWARP